MPSRPLLSSSRSLTHIFYFIVQFCQVQKFKMLIKKRIMLYNSNGNLSQGI
jgi:hypothetical protein